MLCARMVTRRFFFFSSRRRHTRLQGDWSSDVCSSDLEARGPQYVDGFGPQMTTDPGRKPGEDEMPKQKSKRALRKRVKLTGTGRLRRYQDRKSTRLNSSHLVISYAVFCLKKKKNAHPSQGPTPNRQRQQLGAPTPA